MPRSRAPKILHGRLPTALPHDWRLFRVFKGYDTGAVWISTQECRFILVLVGNGAKDALLYTGWQPLGGSSTTDSWYFSRGFGRFSLTVHSYGTPRSELFPILDSI